MLHQEKCLNVTIKTNNIVRKAKNLLIQNEIISLMITISDEERSRSNFSSLHLLRAHIRRLFWRHKKKSFTTFYLTTCKPNKEAEAHISHANSDSMSQHQICTQSCVIIYLKTHISAPPVPLARQTGFFTLDCGSFFSLGRFTSFFLLPIIIIMMFAFPPKKHRKHRVEDRERETFLKRNRNVNRIISLPLTRLRSTTTHVSEKNLSRTVNQHRAIKDATMEINSWDRGRSTHMCWFVSLAPSMPKWGGLFSMIVN